MRKRVATLPVVVASAVGLNLTLAGQNEAGVANQARQAGEPSSVGRTVDQASSSRPRCTFQQIPDVSRRSCSAHLKP